MSDFDEIAEGIATAGLHSQILASSQLLHKQYPGGLNIDVIGLHAWNELDEAQRKAELPHLLGCYVRRVSEEENARNMEVAVRDTTKTYIDDFDVTILWEDLYPVLHKIGKGVDIEVTVNAGSLVNVLSELSLLQHRLAMRDAGASTEKQ